MPAALTAAPAQTATTITTASGSALPQPEAAGVFEQILRSLQISDPSAVASSPATLPPASEIPPDALSVSAIPQPEEPVTAEATVASKPSRGAKDGRHAITPEESGLVNAPLDQFPAAPIPQVGTALPEAPRVEFDPGRAPSTPTKSVALSSIASAPTPGSPAGLETNGAQSGKTHPDPSQSSADDAGKGGGLTAVAPGSPTDGTRQSEATLTPQPMPSSTGAVASALAPDRKNGNRSVEDVAKSPPVGVPDLTAIPIALAPPAAPSTTPPAPATGVATPAAQIAPALLTLMKATDGTQQITLRLHPGDLGMVQVKIERGPSGLTQVEITADRPGTLEALQRDQPQLHRTLDGAGVPTSGRSITFHASRPVEPSSESTPSSHSGGSQPSASRTGSNSVDADASSGGAKGGYPFRDPEFGAKRRNSSTATAGSSSQPIVTTYRIGLDITA